MRRTWWGRAFAAFMAAWLSFSLTEPALLHSCPVHDNVSASAAAHGVTGHGGGHATSEQASAPAQHEHGPAKGCTCLSQCCATSPVSLASARIVVATVVAMEQRDIGLPEYAYVPAAAEHVLPFQNGPPLAAI